MAMSRSFGATSLTTRSPIRTVPALIASSPATILSRVDLPQPDGPTRMTNSPSAMSIETPRIASTAPYILRTFSIETLAIALPPGSSYLATDCRAPSTAAASAASGMR